MKGLYIRDSFAIEIPDTMTDVKRQIFSDENQAANGPQELYVKMKGSHAGLINGNMAFYIPAEMQDSLTSWTFPYSKPVLGRHFNPEDELPNDPIGRVVDARYVDTSANYNLAAKGGLSVINPLLKEGASKTQIKSAIAKMLSSGLLNDSSWSGLGYLELISKIVDRLGIKKFLDSRYLTVSVAAETDSVLCWHCGHDQKYGPCGHPRGKVYKDEKGQEYKNFYIFGKFGYLEVTCTPVPADQFATAEVTSQTSFSDGRILDQSTLKVKDCLVTVDQIYAVSRDKPFMTHMLTADTRNIYEIRDSLQEVQDIMKVVDKNKETVPQDVLDFLSKEEEAWHKAADAFKVDSVEEKSLFIRIHNSLHDMVRWDGIDNTPPSRIKFHAKLHTLASEGNFNADLIWPNDALDMTLADNGVTIPKEYKKDSQEPATELPAATEPPKAKDEASVADKPADKPVEPPAPQDDFFSSLAAFDEANITEDVAEKINELLEAEVEGDAKLSAEKRKSLKSTSFCGPSKSFPVPNCAHYTAAKRLLGRYKGPGDKKKILACIERKGKALGCTGSKEKKDSFTVDSIVEMDLDTVKKIYDFVVQRLIDEKAFSAFDCDGCRGFEKQLDEMTKNLEVVDTENGLLREENEALEDNYSDSLRVIRELKAELVLDLRTMKGEKIEDYAVARSQLATETVEVLDSKVKELYDGGLDRGKIADRLNSGLTNIPSANAEVLNPTLETPPGKKVKEETIQLTQPVLDEIKSTYLSLRLSRGFQAANAYLDGLKQNKVISPNFNPEK